jgi:voltage-gated potassium channel
MDLTVNRVLAQVLRRMRLPLLVLITAYAVSILGFVLIPGVDEQGRPWRMDFFHAFYFVSYLASTIGFGEIPHAFNAAQRLWTTISIYLTVISWLYAIGIILTIIQDATLKRAAAQARFARAVRRIVEPFFLVCGYGDTGSLLAGALAHRGMRTVVIDIDPDRIDELTMAGLPVYIPGLCADAGESDNLVHAGLTNPRCAGVVALTNDDAANLQIAITSKLLNPKLQVICRAETHDTEANMVSFGTDHVVNPFDRFAHRLAMALHSPAIHLIDDWLTGIPGTVLSNLLEPPRGTWVLCGYGRFGKAVKRYLEYEGVDTVVVEADPARTQPPKNTVIGRGTEAVTLRAAKVEQAVGIVAGTDNDTNNLSVVVTARDLNPGLFTVARQNRRSDASLFRIAEVDLVMERADIIAHEILALITTPLLSDFLRIVRHRKNAWANELASRLIGIVGEVVPDIWTVTLDQSGAPAPVDTLTHGGSVTIADLYRDPRDRQRRLSCIALLHKRGSEDVPLPEDGLALAPGDRILFCGREGVRGQMAWILQNRNALRYIQTGHDRPDGWIWRWLAERSG